MTTRRLIVACLTAWIATSMPLRAHPAPFSYLDLRIGPETIEASLVLHVYDIAQELKIEPVDRLMEPEFARSQTRAIAALIASRLTLTANGRTLAGDWSGTEVVPDRHAVRLRARFAVDAPPATVTIAASLFPYDAQHQTFINVYEGDALTQAVLGGRKSEFQYFSGTRQGVVAVVQKFVPAGVHHIMIGPDHILFLIGLLLLGGSLKRLALIVTGFTLAHSVTLSLAALDILTPPARLIEPAIALSIVYVGADNLLKREGRDVRAWIAFAFGLIHGFGFANVLREMDLPSRALGWSLFSFNLGVEIGQLLIVGVVAALLAALRSRNAVLNQRLVVAGSVVVIAFGAYWFIERLVFPGGS
jgi:hydrogenase/urease accessory protein HupE